MSFGYLKYFESYDSGVSFLSITDEENAQKLQNEFFLRLKESIKEEPVFSGQYKLSDFFSVTRNREDPHAYIEIRHTAEKVPFAEVTLPCAFLPGHNFPPCLLPLGDDDFSMRMDYDGIVSMQTGSASLPYSQESRFAPVSLIVKSRIPVSDELPIAAKALDIAVSRVMPHMIYNPEKKTFSIPDHVLYGGMNRQNLFCGFMDYLNGKFLDFLKAGKPEDYRIFPEEIEKRFSDLTHWHTWCNEHRNFLRTGEDGEVTEKRPADFLHCLILTVHNGKFLMCQSAENFRATGQNILTAILEIIRDLLQDHGQYFSVEQSLAEYQKIVEDEGYDPLQKMKDFHESCMALATGEIGFYLLLSRKLYAHIDKTRRQLRKKYDRFLVRKLTTDKGIGMETYAIAVNEVCQNEEPPCYALKMAAFDRALRQSPAGFSLLRITQALREQPQDSAESPALPSGENIFTTLYQDLSQLHGYYDGFLRFFHSHSLVKAVEHSFNDQKYKLSQLVYMKNILQLRGNDTGPTVRLLPLESAPYDLNAEFESSVQILQTKQEIKQALLDASKKKTERVFNFALAVFGAFGVASSIVSILLSDIRSKGISVIAMVAYLLIVAISYRRCEE